MTKRPISFRISKEMLERIREEAGKRKLTVSALIEERLNPFSEFKIEKIK